jgi:hypothetical protein
LALPRVKSPGAALPGWRRSADRARLQPNFPANREFYREFCTFAAPWTNSVARKPLCRSAFSHNSLLKLTGKIFRRSGNLLAITGNFKATEAFEKSLQADEHSVSALERWSQPVDATLCLKGEMECALMGQRFHRGFTAAGENGVMGSLEARRVAEGDRSHRRSIFWWLHMVGFVLRSGVAPGWH